AVLRRDRVLHRVALHGAMAADSRRGRANVAPRPISGVVRSVSQAGVMAAISGALALGIAGVVRPTVVGMAGEEAPHATGVAGGVAGEMPGDRDVVEHRLALASGRAVVAAVVRSSDRVVVGDRASGEASARAQDAGRPSGAVVAGVMGLALDMVDRLALA